MKNKMYGWVGKICRINLSDRKISFLSTADLIPDYIGGRGFCAKFAWNELPPDVGAFDEENKVFIMTGPLTGTLGPGSGRVCIGSVSPQRFPQERYTRSTMGGRWGPELKYAGFDGLIIEGKSSKPVYL